MSGFCSTSPARQESAGGPTPLRINRLLLLALLGFQGFPQTFPPEAV